MYLPDPVEIVGDVLGGALGGAAVDEPGQRDLAVYDAAFDVCRIDVAMGREPVVQLFADALVGPLVPPWPAARMRPRHSPALGARPLAGAETLTPVRPAVGLAVFGVRRIRGR